MSQSAKSLPQKITHHGKYCRLEPLDSKVHGKDLWLAIGKHEELWTYLFSGPFADEKSFFEWLKICENHSQRCYFSILNNAGKALGALCLIDADLTNSTIEIGGISFSRELQKTRIASEAIFLLGRYVFTELGFRRFQWKCHIENIASQKAAQRFGFQKEGILRNHMIVKNKSRDSVFFSIIIDEWPNCQKAFEMWLDEGNFDAMGMQKKRLKDFRITKLS